MRLYVVKVEYEYAVLAESPERAALFAKQAAKDDEALDEAATAQLAADKGYALPLGWERDWPTYGPKALDWDQSVKFDQQAAMAAKETKET